MTAAPSNLATVGAHPPDAAPVVTLSDVGSTNDEALSRLRGSDVALWVVAERQTAGRGRRGRPWVSKPGNLYASFAFIPVLSDAAFSILPLAAAVAVADAVESTGVQATLKWPNDVLVEGRKVAGILIETETSGPSTRRRAVVGIGANIAHDPPGAMSTCLAMHAPGVTVHGLFAALRSTLAGALEVLSADDGVAAIRDNWLARAAGLGEAITVRLETDTLEGVFERLDESGRLVLRGDDGAITLVAAGDVFLRNCT